MFRLLSKLAAAVMAAMLLTSCTMPSSSPGADTSDTASLPSSSVMQSVSEEPSLSSAEGVSSEDFLFSPITVDELYGQRVRDVYEIDKNCVEELNKDLNASNVARGYIVDKYIQQWEAEMEYYYDILYGALNEEGKQQLQRSQEAWQTMYDTDIALNGTIQAMNNIMYDVFDDPYYTRYRERAITLYIKCMAMGNLSDAEGNRVYRILK